MDCFTTKNPRRISELIFWRTEDKRIQIIASIWKTVTEKLRFQSALFYLTHQHRMSKCLVKKDQQKELKREKLIS